MHFSSTCSNENVFLITNPIAYSSITGRSRRRKGIKTGYGGKKKKKKKNKRKKKKKNKKKKNKKNKNLSDKKTKNPKNKKARTRLKLKRMYDLFIDL